MKPRPLNLIAVGGADIVLHDAETSLSTPSGSSDGESVDSLNNHEGSIALFELKLTAASSVTLSDANLYGKSGDDPWMLHGELNDGEDIDLTSDVGYRTRILHSPEVDRYAVGASLSSSVAVTVELLPLREIE